MGGTFPSTGFWFFLGQYALCGVLYWYLPVFRVFLGTPNTFYKKTHRATRARACYGVCIFLYPVEYTTVARSLYRPYGLVYPITRTRNNSTIKQNTTTTTRLNTYLLERFAGIVVELSLLAEVHGDRMLPAGGADDRRRHRKQRRVLREVGHP